MTTHALGRASSINPAGIPQVPLYNATFHAALASSKRNNAPLLDLARSCLVPGVGRLGRIPAAERPLIHDRREPITYMTLVVRLAPFPISDK